MHTLGHFCNLLDFLYKIKVLVLDFLIAIFLDSIQKSCIYPFPLLPVIHD